MSVGFGAFGALLVIAALGGATYWVLTEPSFFRPSQD